MLIIKCSCSLSVGWDSGFWQREDQSSTQGQSYVEMGRNRRGQGGGGGGWGALSKSDSQRKESVCAQEWMRDERGKRDICKKWYGMKMQNYTTLYRGTGRGREQEEQSKEKNNWAKERGKGLWRKMRDDRGKGWVREEIKEKQWERVKQRRGRSLCISAADVEWWANRGNTPISSITHTLTLPLSLV